MFIRCTFCSMSLRLDDPPLHYHEVSRIDPPWNSWNSPNWCADAPTAACHRSSQGLILRPGAGPKNRLLIQMPSVQCSSLSPYSWRLHWKGAPVFFVASFSWFWMLEMTSSLISKRYPVSLLPSNHWCAGLQALQLRGHCSETPMIWPNYSRNWFMSHYPLVNIQKAIEHGHL
jgi:hypothetical protein